MSGNVQCCHGSWANLAVQEFGSAMPFIRQCIECRKCATRYLIAFSPYRNGSYLWRASLLCVDEYVLYCSCQQPPVLNNCKNDELRSYVVSKAAHQRGYGTSEEIFVIDASAKLRRKLNSRA